MITHAPHLPSDSNTPHPRHRLITISLACVFGLLAGVVGSLVSAAWLTPPSQSIFFGQQVKMSQKIVLDVNRVGLMRQVTVIILRPSSVAATAPYAARIINDADKIGAGVLLTADGWILTDATFDKQNFDVLLPDGSVQRVKETVKDPLTGIVFANVGGGPFTVAPLGKLAESEIGSVLSVPLPGGAVHQTLLKNPSAVFCITQSCALSRSSEELYTGGVIDRLSSLPGAPVFNDQGEIVGLYHDVSGGAQNLSGAIVSVETLPKIIDDVLIKKIASRAMLGVKFLDLARTRVRGITGAARVGAAIMAVKAPKKNVPTIKVGDIMIAVEDETLGMEKTLPEILSAYKPGASVNLRVLREGKEEKILVELQ